MLHSSTVFDEMIHIPFIVHFPKDANITPKRIEHIASLLDVAPTLAEIYGIQTPPEFNGRSLLPAIRHNLPVNDYIYAEIADGDKTVRDTTYKYMLSPKYGELLFHLPRDPGELQNRIDEFPVTAGYYRQLLRGFSKQAPSEHSEKTVDLNTLDEKTIEHLKELGYIQ
jgi:arylsulfatase A-like enzyme